MGIQKTLALLALLVTNNACQKNQDQTSETTADTITVPQERSARAGYVFCFQSEDAYAAGSPVFVFKDSAQICRPCTMVSHEANADEPVIEVLEKTRKIPDIVAAPSLSEFAQSLETSCNFAVMPKSMQKSLDMGVYQRRFSPMRNNGPFN